MPDSHENVLFQICQPRERVTISPFWPCTARLLSISALVALGEIDAGAVAQPLVLARCRDSDSQSTRLSFSMPL